ncbi:MAG: DUF1491 family protein [Proteobacteria bacterium]|nr:DUF1491 family protein [Pseudomonadota bacterium]
MEARLPARLEVSGLIRAVEAAGGHATVLAKGEADAGTILVVLCEKGSNSRLYERMPGLDGVRRWHLAKSHNAEKPQEFPDYLDRRRRQDSDLWIVELDIANGERFIGLSSNAT